MLQSLAIQDEVVSKFRFVPATRDRDAVLRKVFDLFPLIRRYLDGRELAELDDAVELLQVCVEIIGPLESYLAIPL